MGISHYCQIERLKAESLHPSGVCLADCQADFSHFELRKREELGQALVLDRNGGSGRVSVLVVMMLCGTSVSLYTRTLF